MLSLQAMGTEAHLRWRGLAPWHSLSPAEPLRALVALLLGSRGLPGGRGSHLACSQACSVRRMLSEVHLLPTASMPTSETESVNTENVSGEGETRGCCGSLW